MLHIFAYHVWFFLAARDFLLIVVQENVQNSDGFVVLINRMGGLRHMYKSVPSNLTVNQLISPIMGVMSSKQNNQLSKNIPVTLACTTNLTGCR